MNLAAYIKMKKNEAKCFRTDEDPQYTEAEGERDYGDEYLDMLQDQGKDCWGVK